MARLLISFLFLVLFVLSAFGQTKQAQKIDVFGNSSCEEYLVRMETAQFVFSNNPDSKIYIFVYEGKTETNLYKKGKIVGEQSFLPQYRLADTKIESMKKYLAFKKIPAENYVFINGGFREDFAVEIWLVPNGAEPPKPSPTIKKMKYRKGKPVGFCLGCCD